MVLVLSLVFISCDDDDTEESADDDDTEESASLSGTFTFILNSSGVITGISVGGSTIISTNANYDGTYTYTTASTVYTITISGSSSEGYTYSYSSTSVSSETANPSENLSSLGTVTVYYTGSKDVKSVTLTTNSVTTQLCTRIDSDGKIYYVYPSGDTIYTLDVAGHSSDFKYGYSAATAISTPVTYTYERIFYSDTCTETISVIIKSDNTFEVTYETSKSGDEKEYSLGPYTWFTGAYYSASTLAQGAKTLTSGTISTVSAAAAFGKYHVYVAEYGEPSLSSYWNTENLDFFVYAADRDDFSNVFTINYNESSGEATSVTLNVEFYELKSDYSTYYSRLTRILTYYLIDSLSDEELTELYNIQTDWGETYTGAKDTLKWSYNDYNADSDDNTVTFEFSETEDEEDETLTIAYAPGDLEDYLDYDFSKARRITVKIMFFV